MVKKISAGKVLNYDVLQCESCGNYTMAFWSASAFGAGGKGTSPKDAKDVVEFLGFLLRLTYNLPEEIEQFRKRREGKS
jgi:hypothetical protein